MKKRYEINILDALYFMKQTSDQISENTIKKCFQKVGFPGAQVESYENDDNIAPGINFNVYVTCDDRLSIFA